MRGKEHSAISRAMNPRSGSASLASMSCVTWRSVVKWCRARADMARPRPSMPGNRTATLPIGTSPPRFCSMLLSFILVPRRSRYVCLVRLAGKETQTVVQALAQHVQRLPAGLMTTLTWDRGLELAAHRTFSIATGVQVYFCDPQSPWQRGTNENTNGLLRQYLPKGTDLAAYTQTQLDAIALQLNTRPRKTLGYRTPAATLAETVASTG